jgi:hypothetical protein
MDIAAFITSLLGLIGVTVAIFTIRSNSNLHRRQMNAEVFMKYADEVWKIWEHELIRILQSPLFKREWQELESEFRSYPEFLDFVNRAQRTQLPTPFNNLQQLQS